MIEWQDPWNSFNSWKALMYREQYKAIQAGKFLPPIEASIDPVNDCQLNCFFCNGTDVRNRKTRMTTDHLLQLCEFIIGWGVRGICFAGGGEPTMHEALGDIFGFLKAKGMPTAIITNGLFLDDKQLGSIAVNSEWIGVSVDCAKAETYKKMKGSDRFEEVRRNIIALTGYFPKEVTFKFLINTVNQFEIYDAIKLAAQIGCHGIHIRPVSFRNFQEKEEDFNLPEINAQVEAGFADFGSRIRIFAVRHKFNEQMHVKFPFKKCMATPIMPIFQGNGTVTLCIDRKADDSLILCRHDNVSEILKVWGSDYHKALIDKINLAECPKCTIQHCQEQYEKAIVEDRMNYAFV
jgi:MoaA/NifB/PqqE/SkfB family radical SAM enzyme